MRRVYLHSYTPSWRGALIKDRDYCTLNLYNTFWNLRLVSGGMSGKRWRSWLRHCSTNQKVAGSIPYGIIGIFHCRNPTCRRLALGMTQPLAEMSTRSVAWEMHVAERVGHLHVLLLRNSGCLSLREPKETVQACNWVTFYCSCASSLAYT